MNICNIFFEELTVWSPICELKRMKGAKENSVNDW